VAFGVRTGPECLQLYCPAPNGLGKGSPYEVVAIGVQGQRDALHGSTGWLLLQVDLRNALNSIARPAILEALERLCTPSCHGCGKRSARPPAGWAGGYLVDPGSAAG